MLAVSISLLSTLLIVSCTIPENTTAIYAGCLDLIPTLAELIPDNVGKGYTKPVIKVGDEEIGDAETDKDGRITRINVPKTIGYIRPSC